MATGIPSTAKSPNSENMFRNNPLHDILLTLMIIQVDKNLLVAKQCLKGSQSMKMQGSGVPSFPHVTVIPFWDLSNTTETAKI